MKNLKLIFACIFIFNAAFGTDSKDTVTNNNDHPFSVNKCERFHQAIWDHLNSMSVKVNDNSVSMKNYSEITMEEFKKNRATIEKLRDIWDVKCSKIVHNDDQSRHVSLTNQLLQTINEKIEDIENKEEVTKLMNEIIK